MVAGANGGRARPSSSARSAMISDGAAGRGDHAQPVPAQQPGLGGPPVPGQLGQHPGRDDQVLQGPDPGHAQPPEHAVDHRVVTGQRAGVGLGGVLGGDAAADLEGHDRLTRGQRPAGHRGEFGRLPDGLQEQRDDLGRRVVDQVIHQVGHRQQGLVAHRHQQADAQVAGLGEAEHGAGQAAALQHHPDRAAQQRHRDRQPVGRDPGGRVDVAVAVRAEHGQPALAGEGDDLGLPPGPFRAGLTEPGGQDDEGPHAGVGALPQDVQHHAGGHHDVGQVHRARQAGQGPVGPLAVHHLGPRVDQVHRPAELVQPQIGVRVGRPAGLVGRTDQGDRARMKQCPHSAGGIAAPRRRGAHSPMPPSLT